MEGGGRQFQRMEVGGRLFPGIYSKEEFTRYGKEQEKVHMKRRKAEAVSRNERIEKRASRIKKEFPGMQGSRNRRMMERVSGMDCGGGGMKERQFQ
jgi:hypothetical protein